jgi:hypothetical protein
LKLFKTVNTLRQLTLYSHSLIRITCLRVSGDLKINLPSIVALPEVTAVADTRCKRLHVQRRLVNIYY